MLDKQHIKERILDDAKKFFFVFVYVWAFSALFALHKTFILGGKIISGQGLAIVNGLVLGKVIFLAETFHVAERLEDKPPIYPILYKSAVFTIILIFVHILEEVIRGILHGRAIAQSIIQAAGGDIQRLLTEAILVFIVFIPFFAYREIGRVIGKEELHALLFRVRTRGGTIQPRLQKRESQKRPA